MKECLGVVALLVLGSCVGADAELARRMTVLEERLASLEEARSQPAQKAPPIFRPTMQEIAQAKHDKAQTDVKLLADAVRIHYVKFGRMPDTLDVLAEKDARGRCLLEEVPTDPWGSAYELLVGDTPRSFQVLSCGPDGSVETDDDITDRLKGKR